MRLKFTTILTSLLCILGQANAQVTHQIKIQLDTKKFPNFNCSLNAPADGVGISPLTEVYMHAGVCWRDPANPSSETSASLFCAAQITPLNSQVWQSVVGNWGDNPLADGVGQMVNEGNGIFTKEFIVEQYFSSSDVSTATEPISGVTSQPMPAGRTAYTMGLVFRDPTGAITGRDNACNDIFIYQLETANPKVIRGSDLSEWPDGPVSFIYQTAGIETNQLFYERNIAPNPMTGDRAKINFYVRENQPQFSIVIYDAQGRQIKQLYNGALPAGKQTAIWDGTTNAGERAANGMYYFTLTGGNNAVSDKIMVNR